MYCSVKKEVIDKYGAYRFRSAFLQPFMLKAFSLSIHEFISVLQEVRTIHNVRLDLTSVQELRKACELAKRKLSTLAEVPVSVFFSRHNLGFKSTISRASFENLIGDLLKRTIVISSDVLAQSKVIFPLTPNYFYLLSSVYYIRVLNFVMMTIRFIVG